jgi:glycosyltransferase involved in cell wall biosynthesis
MKLLLISPYHGGSHQAWAEGYQAHSSHEVRLLTMPDRFWKWRMHGGAVTLARRFLEDNYEPDVILATDMLDLTTFLALTRHRTSQVPAGIYMHENQLTYPLPQDGRTGPMRRQLGERDQHYAFINYASMCAANFILFNSHYHHDSFFNALPDFLKHFPEYNELNTIAALQAKSQVLPVGVDFKRLAREQGSMLMPGKAEVEAEGNVPLVLWNQRWEYDKNPADFFKALAVVAEEGIFFRLALCGQQYGKRPPAFDSAIEQLSDYIIHTGYANDERYKQLLWAADIIISTAHHEFFGISILEAIYCHTFPILPHRLSYPELIPEAYHLNCLYQNQLGLVERLRWALTHLAGARQAAHKLGLAVSRYDWSHLAPTYDQMLMSWQK